MREIKFRAWIKEEEIMTYFEDESYILNGDMTVDAFDYEKSNCKNYFEPCYKTVDVELMQYTGLKDKNEKEIYEGDIIKVPVMRHSSSNWWQNTNINHGDCGDFVYKKVEYVKYKYSYQENLGGFTLTDMPITKKQKEEIAKPRGKERIKQCVDDINYKFQELEVIGNIYENPELLEDKE